MTLKKKKPNNNKETEKEKKKKKTEKIQQILWLQKSLMVVMATVRICYVNKTNMQLVFSNLILRV